MIVFNAFLDSLCNLGFKNIGLTPGIQKACFQHSQDVVKMSEFNDNQLSHFSLIEEIINQPHHF